MLLNVPHVDALLERHADALGDDFDAYRNHVYRVSNFYALLHGRAGLDLDLLAVAASFHDLGMWTARSFDYLEPSIALAVACLDETGRAGHAREVTAMIANHHRLRPCPAGLPRSVEVFRRADWIDVSAGWLKFGLSSCVVAQVMALFPDAGFRRLLLRRLLRHIRRHPFDPLPMLRW